VDVQIAGTMRSDQGDTLAANWAAPNSVIAPSLGRSLSNNAPSVLTASVTELDQGQPSTASICVALVISWFACAGVMPLPLWALTASMKSRTLPQAPDFPALIKSSAACSFDTRLFLNPGPSPKLFTTLIKSVTSDSAVLIVTVNPPVAVSPCASTAEQLTGVVPITNVDPEAGEQATATVPSTRSDADAE
jgi:hypothetical protein